MRRRRTNEHENSWELCVLLPAHEPGANPPTPDPSREGNLPSTSSDSIASSGLAGAGVGSDVTYATNAKLDWRFVKHFGLSFGYALLHFELSNSVAQRNVSVEPTIHGPLFGCGIYF